MNPFDNEGDVLAYGKSCKATSIKHNWSEYTNDDDEIPGIIKGKDSFLGKIIAQRPAYEEQANMQKARVFHSALAEEEANELKMRVFRSALTEEEAEAYYQEWKASLDEIEPPPIYQLRFYWQDSEF